MHEKQPLSRRKWMEGIGLALLGLTAGAVLVDKKKGSSKTSPQIPTPTPTPDSKNQEGNWDINPIENDKFYVFHQSQPDIATTLGSTNEDDYYLSSDSETYYIPKVEGGKMETVVFAGPYPFGTDSTPPDFKHDIFFGNKVPNEFVWIAYQLYSHDVSFIKKSLVPYALALQRTESDFDGRTVAGGIGKDINFTNVNPRRGSSFKTEQKNALKIIANWIGDQNIINMAKMITGWDIKNLDGIPCSSDCAIGQKQFLPTTWILEVNRRLSAWTPEQHKQFLDQLKNLGLIRKEITSIKDFNPFIYSEAFIMGLLYMDTINLTTSGANFSSWNNDPTQQSNVTNIYYPIAKKGLDRLLNGTVSENQPVQTPKISPTQVPKESPTLAPKDNLEYYYPVAGITAGQIYGYKDNGCKHWDGDKGSMDIAADGPNQAKGEEETVDGTSAIAVTSGEAFVVEYSLGGHAIVLKGDDGLYYYFAHLRDKNRISGRVSAGQKIGEVSNSGNAITTPTHLHFAIYKTGTWNGTNFSLGGKVDVWALFQQWGLINC